MEHCTFHFIAKDSYELGIKSKIESNVYLVVEANGMCSNKSGWENIVRSQ